MRRTDLRQLSRIARQMAALLRAGCPLPEALTRVSASFPAVADGLRRASDSVQGGSGLAPALEAAAFPSQMVELVRAGESAECLTAALEQAAVLLAAARDRQLSLEVALTYPKLLLTSCLAIFMFVFVYVGNTFAQLFEGMHMALPMLTRLFIGCVNALHHPSAQLLVLALWIGCLMGLSVGGGMTLPVVATVLRCQEAAIWLQWMEAFTELHTPMPQAVRMAAAGLSGPFRGLMEEVAEHLSRGGTLAEALGSTHRFPPLGGFLVAYAEQAEFRRGLLRKAGQVLQRDADMVTTYWLAMLEPLSIWLLGSMVGLIVLAVFLPLYQLIGSLS